MSNETHSASEQKPARGRLKRVLYDVLQWTWGILQNLSGFFLFLFLKLKRPKRKTGFYREAVFAEWSMNGSMALGMFLFLGPAYGKEAEFIKAHEYGHTVQSIILGPFYLPVIGLPSLIRANVAPFSRNWKSGKTDYYAFYTERWANRLGKARR